MLGVQGYKHHARQLGESDGCGDARVDAVAVARAGAAAVLEVHRACKMRASRAGAGLELKAEVDARF